MFSKADSVKRYSSAKSRFLKPMIMAFFRNEFPKLFGPVMREKLADELTRLFEQCYRDVRAIRPGQLLWIALDKNTRGDSPNRRFVPVVLSIVTPNDIQRLEGGANKSTVAKDSIARMMNEAYQQGGILSTRDIALFTLRNHGNLSQLRLSYEREHDLTLPHTGALHDMGSTVTHKAIIVNKVVLQKKDPALVAMECSHSQRAVDRYLKDYNRVKTLHEQNQDITFIHQVTGIAKHVVKQYLDIIQHENAQNKTT